MIQYMSHWKQAVWCQSLEVLSTEGAIDDGLMACIPVHRHDRLLRSPQPRWTSLLDRATQKIDCTHEPAQSLNTEHNTIKTEPGATISTSTLMQCCM